MLLVSVLQNAFGTKHLLVIFTEELDFLRVMSLTIGDLDFFCGVAHTACG